MIRNPNPQEAFSAAWRGLARQGWQKTGPWGGTEVQPARNGDLLCACAHVHAALGTFPMFFEVGDRWIVDLQRAHDYAESPADMELRMRAVAANHGLSIPGDSPKDDGFAAFKAKVLAPIDIESVSTPQGIALWPSVL